MSVLFEVLRNSRAPRSSLSRCWAQCVRRTSVSSASVTENKSSTPETIDIPNRIHRRPTDILNALNKTAQLDVTGPPYRLYDDPYLAMFGGKTQRAASFSEEAGRNAARWVRDQHPELFQQVIADPPVKYYLSQKPITDDTPVDEALLSDKIRNACVSDAKKVYELMVSKGMDVSHHSKQALLELLCYYNCKDPIPVENVAERYHIALLKGEVNVWQDDPLVRSLFDSLEPKDSAYCAMICGLYRYNNRQEGDSLFEEAKAKNMKLNVKVYNSYIARLKHSYELQDTQIKLLMGALNEMASKGIKPNIDTLNSLLPVVVLSKISSKYELMKQLLQEFRNQGVEPSLGSYGLIARSFRYSLSKGNAAQAIDAIVNGLEGQVFTVRHSEDLKGFFDIMEACASARHYKAAIKTLEISHSVNNLELLGVALNRLTFYSAFMRVLIHNAPLEVTIQYYHKLVPHLATLTPRAYMDLFELLEDFGALEHVAPFWADCFYCFNRDQETTMKILSVAVNLTSYPLPLPLQEEKSKLAGLAKFVLNCILSEDQQIYQRGFVFTPDMANYLLILFAQAYDWSSVQSLLKLQKERSIAPLNETIQKAVTWSLENQDIDMGVWLVKFCLENFKLGGEQAKQLYETGLLTEKSREELRQILEDNNPADSDSDTSSSSSSCSESDGDSSESDDDLSIPKKSTGSTKTSL